MIRRMKTKDPIIFVDRYDFNDFFFSLCFSFQVKNILSAALSPHYHQFKVSKKPNQHLKASASLLLMRTFTAKIHRVLQMCLNLKFYIKIEKIQIRFLQQTRVSSKPQFHKPRSSTCPLTSFFWLLSHVIYLKLTEVL